MTIKGMGGRVLYLRLKRGWTQKELAEAIGITAGGLSGIEMNKTALSVHLMNQMEKVFGEAVAVRCPECEGGGWHRADSPKR